MIIRFLTQDDIVSHDKVTSQAFCISCDIGDKKSVLPSEKVLGAFDDDNKTLFADFEIIERKCYFEGYVITCAAIGGVAAKPEHRGKGAVKELFYYLNNLNEYDISILYPFSEEYYRKLGYERVGNSVCATVPFTELFNIKRNNDAALYENNDKEKLLEIYNKCAEKYNLCFVRENTDAFSGDPYYSNKYTYIWKNNSFATISVDREKSIVEVHEIYFDSCESMLGILGFLRNFEGNQKYIRFQKIPENSPVFNFVKDLKPCDIKLFNTGSVRVLNVEKILKTHKYPSGNGEFTLKIDNNSFKVVYADNNVEIFKNCVSNPDVIMDINTASRVLLSGITNKEYIPNLIINNPESSFFNSFPYKTTFFTDGF